MIFCVCLNVSEHEVGLANGQKTTPKNFQELFTKATEGKSRSARCKICIRGLNDRLIKPGEYQV